ncbi:hypothetical protein P3S67_030446 [Capsicum chacoense]
MVLPLMRYRLLLKQVCKGKEIVSGFSTFEVGSTSATPTKHNNLEATIAITDMSPQTETGSTSRVVPKQANNIVGCLLTFEIGAQSQLQPLNNRTPKQQLLALQVRYCLSVSAVLQE